MSSLLRRIAYLLGHLLHAAAVIFNSSTYSEGDDGLSWHLFFFLCPRCYDQYNRRCVARSGSTDQLTCVNSPSCPRYSQVGQHYSLSRPRKVTYNPAIRSSETSRSVTWSPHKLHITWNP